MCGGVGWGYLHIRLMVRGHLYTSSSHPHPYHPPTHTFCGLRVVTLGLRVAISPAVAADGSDAVEPPSFGEKKKSKKKSGKDMDSLFAALEADAEEAAAAVAAEGAAPSTSGSQPVAAGGRGGGEGDLCGS